MPNNQNKKVLDEIKNHLDDFTKVYEDEVNRQKKKDKKENTENIKEKSQSNNKSADPSQDDSEKEMNALRKSFSESFNKLDNFTSPGNLVKIGGLLSNSPLLMMAGEQLDQMRQSYKDQREKQREDQKAIADSKKNDFLNEAKEEESLKLREEQNELLKRISDNTDDLQPKKDSGKGGLLGILGGLFSLKKLKNLKGLLSFKNIGKVILGSFVALRKSVFGVFKGIFGKGGTKGLFKGAFKKGLIKGFAKGLLKGLVRFIAAPITVLFAAFDFYKGFKNAEDIVGREGLAAKFQGGLSQMISGFTLGLVDPKFISQKIDEGVEYLQGLWPTIKEKFMRFVLAPITLFKNMFSGEKGIVESLKIYISDMTGISTETYDSLFSFMTEKIKGLITEPLNYIKDYMVNMWDNLKPMIEDYILRIKEQLFAAKEKLMNVLKNPLDTIKGLFSKDDESIDQTVKKSKQYELPNSKPYNNIPSKAIKGMRKSDSRKSEKSTNNVVQQNNSVTHTYISKDMGVYSDDHSIYNPVPTY